MSGNMESVLFAALGAALLLAGTGHDAKAQVASVGPNFGGGGIGGGGGGPITMRRICVGGPNELCFYPRRPRPKMTEDNCCWQRVQRKRLRLFGQWRTVYVDKGRKCVKVTTMRQCMKRVRRGR